VRACTKEFSFRSAEDTKGVEKRRVGGKKEPKKEKDKKTELDYEEASLGRAPNEGRILSQAQNT